MKSARRVDNQHVRASLLSVIQRIVNYSRRVTSLVLLYDIRARSLAPYCELIDSRGSEGISRRNNDLLASCYKSVGDLTDRGGLARAVDTDNEDYRRSCGEIKLSALSDHLCEYRLERVDDLILFLKSARLYVVAQSLHYFLSRADTDVRHYKKLLKLVKKILVYLDERLEHLVYLSENCVFSFRKTGFKLIQKSHPSLLLSYLKSRLRRARAPSRYLSRAS